MTFFAGKPFLIVILRKRGLRGAQAADEGSMYLGCKSSASLTLPGDTPECTDPSSESCAPRRTRFLRMTVQKVTTSEHDSSKEDLRGGQKGRVVGGRGGGFVGGGGGAIGL